MSLEQGRGMARWSPTVNDNPHPTDSKAMLTGAIVFQSLATVIVIIKVYTRCTITYGFGVDDVLIVLAQIPAIGHTTLVILLDLRYDGSRHIWDIPLQQIVTLRKLNLSMLILFALACTLTRISMLALVHRLAAKSSKAYQWVILASIILIIAQCICFIFIVVFRCSPMSEMWIPKVDSSNCLNESSVLLAFGIANTVSNFVVVFMPIPIIWNTQMPVGRRMKVTALLTLGLLACSAGIVRTIYTARYTASRDKTWDIIPVLIASTVELNLGIICTSIPGIIPLIQKYFVGGIPRNAALSRTLESRETGAIQNYHLTNFSRHSKIKNVTRCPKEDGESQTEILVGSAA